MANRLSDEIINKIPSKMKNQINRNLKIILKNSQN